MSTIDVVAGKSGAAECRRLALDEIRADGTVQGRTGLDREAVLRYAAAYDDDMELPPVDVFHDGKVYWLADGFHRLAARRNAGLDDIVARVHNGDERAAILFACGANDTHGLPRSNEDKRRAVERLLGDDEWKTWSDNQIAKRCRVSHTFVAKFRAKLDLTSNVSSERRCRTKHGTVTTMDTSRIGKQHRSRASGSAPRANADRLAAERAVKPSRSRS